MQQIPWKNSTERRYLKIIEIELDTYYNYNNRIVLKIALRMGKPTNKGQPERPIVFLNDGYEQTLRSDKKVLFQKYLNLQDRRVKTTEEEVNGKEKPDSKHSSIRLYKCWHTATKYRIEEIKPGPLFQSDMNSNVLIFFFFFDIKC